MRYRKRKCNFKITRVPDISDLSYDFLVKNNRDLIEECSNIDLQLRYRLILIFKLLIFVKIT